ncbi:hypothetical protein MAH1_19700 [Sessilibacter sp. MAH1]
MKTLFAYFSIISLSLALVACGGSSGSGADVIVNQDTSNDIPPMVVYNGPDPANDDVQNFRLNVWENLARPDRCGACHDTGETPPTFVRTDDINLAYAEVNALVDLENPAQSRLVTKVAEPHNCWLAVNSVCLTLIEGFIHDWAEASGTSSNSIELTAPVLRDVGGAQVFPQDSSEFSATVYPLLSAFCSDCHSEDSSTPQQPFFGSSDVDVAYAAAQPRIDLATPTNSRLVIRLNESHNCWSDCPDNAITMAEAIAALSGTIPVTEVDPALVISRAVNLTSDGIIASSGGRVETNLIALWDFSEGEGRTAFDTSGVEPSVNLNLTGDVEWVGGFGIDIGDGGRAQAPTSQSRKLYDLITATGEYTVEAWVVPANVSQDGPARIVSYSGSANTRNLLLGQTEFAYDFLARSSTSDANGEPALSTDNGDEILQATLQHVVATFDPVDGRRLYVNGVLVAEEGAAGGNLNAWNSSFALVLGSEVDGTDPWQGVIRLLAIHNRAMSQEDIINNFEVGVGERFFLLFNVEEHTNVSESYIAFEVQQLDSFSYLFTEPFFISLDPNATIGQVHIEGMYLGVNGQEAEVGQAFANLDVDITTASYDPVNGQVLSRLGALVPLDFGPDDDLFFLSFDQIGNSSFNRPIPTPPTAAPALDLEPVSDIGIKTFAEINATLSSVTGVPITQANVAESYNTLQQQLPTVENISGFLTSHQTGIAQLAVAYCNQMVTTQGLTGRDALIDTLLDRLLANRLSVNSGQALNTQPDPETPVGGATRSVRSELEQLYDRILTSTNANAAATATCAAAAGSALMLVQ